MAIPSDLSGLRLWHKADAITGLNDGDPLASGWVDSSGNSFTATQATAGKRPLYKTNISPTGLPVVRFDGVDDELVGTTAANMMNVTFGVATIMVALLITSASSAGANSWLNTSIFAEDAGFFGLNVKDTAGVPSWRVWNWDGTEDFAEVATTYNTWLRLAWDHNNTTLFGYVGAMVTSATSVTTGVTTGGGNITFPHQNGAFLGCDYGEICVWNRVLNSTERQDMAAYLDRWTTAVGPAPAVLAGRLIGEVI